MHERVLFLWISEIDFINESIEALIDCQRIEEEEKETKIYHILKLEK